MSTIKARKAVKPAKANKPRPAVKAVPVKASRPAVKALPRSPAPKAKKPAPHLPQRSQPTARTTPAADTAVDPVVKVKRIKWSAAELKRLRTILQKLHDLAVDDIGFLAGGHLANSADGVAGKSSGGGQDRTEEGTENFAQDLSLLQVSNKQDMLNGIIDALRRVDLGTYGLCEMCGEPIAKPRLQVQPFAARCITCQSAAERNRPRTKGFSKSMVQNIELEA